MGKVLWNPTTLVAPVPPVLATCRRGEKDNVLTIGWTGIINSKPAMTYISVRPERYSYEMIKASGCFVINLATKKLTRATDWCGVRSGKNIDKFKECNLTKSQGVHVNAPVINESPINLECVVTQEINLGSHVMFLAEIKGVHVDEELIDSHGKLRIDKAGIIAYAHGTYFELGKIISTFGFSVKKKNPKYNKNKQK